MTNSEMLLIELRDAIDMLLKGRQQGEWIPIGEPDVNNNQDFECSLCHHKDTHAISQEVPYCWFCGSNMNNKNG